jgi:hypothetical protein
MRSKLTWRDSYGVAVVLSKNVGFSEVLSTVEAELVKTPGYIKGSLRKVAEHHYVVRVTIPSDESRSAEIHVFVYNLYVPQPGRRVVKS